MPSPQSATCSRIQSFQHLVIRVCGDLVRWMNSTVSALGSSSCPRAHVNGVSSLTMQRLALDLGINLLVFRCFFTFAIPIFPDPAVSCVVSKHNKEDLSANMTKNACRDDGNAHDRASSYQGDVHDRASVCQGLLIASFPTLLRLRVSIFLVCCSLYPH